MGLEIAFPSNNNALTLSRRESFSTLFFDFTHSISLSADNSCVTVTSCHIKTLGLFGGSEGVEKYRSNELGKFWTGLVSVRNRLSCNACEIVSGPNYHIFYWK